MVSKLKPTFITDEFVKAILDSIATGNKITLTTSIGSSTIYTDQQLNGINYQQTKGSSKNITAPLNSAVVKLDTNTIIIELDLTNENLNNDFQIATLLINGKYEGNDLLVGVVRFEAPELFPKYDSTTGSIYEIKSRVYLSLSNISNATIAVSNAGMATAQSVQDLRTYVDGAFNSDIARKSIDNIYNGNNTYNKKIIAPAGLQGNSDSSDKLQTARTIQTNLASTTATSFDGTANVVPGVTGTLPIANGGTGNTNGSAVKLTTARTIGGISFDGTKNIDLPGVNANGNQDTSGNADTATTLNYQTIADGTDLNTIKTAGLYGIGAASSLKNAPVSRYFLMEVTTISTTNMKQVVFDTNSNNVWVRSMYAGSTFTSWEILALDDNVLHNSGDESASGTKTFTGTIVANNPIKGNTIRDNILDGYDLNGYKDTGDFVINGANNLVNYPSGASNYASLHVEALSNGTAIQTLKTSDNIIYTRTFGGSPSTFNNWRVIDSPYRILYVPSSIGSIYSLIDLQKNLYGNSSSVKYISSNVSYSDGPHTNNNTFTLTIDLLWWKDTVSDYVMMKAEEPGYTYISYYNYKGFSGWKIQQNG